jgi:glycosyltransferase involved in cell wall biosynthesis
LIILANKDLHPEKEKKGKVMIVRCWRTDSLLLPLNILRNIIKHKPDLVFFNCHMMSWGKNLVANFFGALLPFISRKILNYKVIVILHNLVEAVDLDKLGIKPSKLNLFGSYIATKSLLSADRVIVTLRSFISLLGRKYNRNNIIHIPHGTLGKKVKKPRVGGKTILVFGFWRGSKNLPLIIEAFQELRKKDRSLKLIVAGSSHPNFPGYLERIRKEYEKSGNILFTGYISPEELDKVFLPSTVVVLPYTAATGTSGVIHLAASYGKPIIASDLPEIRETAEDEGFSVSFIPVNDKEALKLSIERIIRSRKLQESMGRRNLKAAENLSFSVISRKYLDTSLEILGDRKI